MDNERDDALSHLTESEKNELMSRYYDGDDRVASLVSEFDIPLTPGRLYTAFPPKVHTDLPCPFCDGTPMESARRSRSSYWTSIPACPKCSHSDTDQCRCRRCTAALRLAEAEAETSLQQAIQRAAGSAATPRAPDDLSLFGQIGVLSLQLHSLSEDLHTAEPFDDIPMPLTPTRSMTDKVFDMLMDNGILGISRSGATRGFSLEYGTNGPNLILKDKAVVEWAFLPALSETEKISYLRDLEHLVAERSVDEMQNAELLEIWHEIAIHECFQCFECLLAQRGYRDVHLGAKTYQIIAKLTKQFSVSQVFYLMFISVRSTTDYVVRNKINYAHAKNIFIGGVERTANKYVTEGWEIKKSHRNEASPRSAISYALFDHYLGIGEKAFTLNVGERG